MANIHISGKTDRKWDLDSSSILHCCNFLYNFSFIYIVTVGFKNFFTAFTSHVSIDVVTYFFPRCFVVLKESNNFPDFSIHIHTPKSKITLTTVSILVKNVPWTTSTFVRAVVKFPAKLGTWTSTSALT